MISTGLAGQHPPRTPGRQAAAVLHAAVVTARTADAACRALAVSGAPATRAAARELPGREAG